MRLVVAAVALFLAACGGGGGGSTSTPVASTPSRPDLAFGYYGSCLTCLAETRDHVTLIWVAPAWNGLQAAVDDMTRAAVPTVLMTPQDPVALRTLFAQLRNANVLRFVAALYPQDEPDVNGFTEAQMQTIANVQRRVASEFVELEGVKLAVIYGATTNRPGLSSFDWVGFDNYDAGAGVLGEELAAFKLLLRTDQRLLLVPGGADPWRTDPRPFYEYAQTDPQVVAVVGFAWLNYDTEHLGIGRNGMASAYRAVGCLIKRTC